MLMRLSYGMIPLSLFMPGIFLANYIHASLSFYNLQ